MINVIALTQFAFLTLGIVFHVDAALSAYLLAGLFLAATTGFLSRSSPALSLSPTISPRTVRSILVSPPWRRWATAILPRTDVARGLAIVEGVGGQLFLAVLIARLVSLYAAGKEAN
jgi:hypothetical protein